MRENFLLLITKASRTDQGPPLHEPSRLARFLLRGKPYRRSTELAKLESSKRGMSAPVASWAIKSLMWQRPLGLSSLLIARMLRFSLLPWMAVVPSDTHSSVVDPGVGTGDGQPGVVVSRSQNSLRSSRVEHLSPCL